jgi:hypothetical protein
MRQEIHFFFFDGTTAVVVAAVFATPVHPFACDSAIQSHLKVRFRGGKVVHCSRRWAASTSPLSLLEQTQAVFPTTRGHIAFVFIVWDQLPWE